MPDVRGRGLHGSIGVLLAALSLAALFVFASSLSDAPTGRAQEELTPGWSGTLTVTFSESTQSVDCTDEMLSTTTYSVTGTDVETIYQDEGGSGWDQPAQWQSRWFRSHQCQYDDGTSCGFVETGSGTGQTQGEAAGDPGFRLSASTVYNTYGVDVRPHPWAHTFETEIDDSCLGPGTSFASPREFYAYDRPLPADQLFLVGERYDEFNESGIVQKTWYSWDLTRLPCEGENTDGDTDADRCDTDDDNDGLSDYQENTRTFTNRLSVDTDGDALLDPWEVDDETIPGAGFDFDSDRLGDVLWNEIGSEIPADPLHKDIFVEVDWMSCSALGSNCPPNGPAYPEPMASALADVEAAFANAPVSNPDGIPGINLHLETHSGANLGVIAVPVLPFEVQQSGPNNDFDDLKDGDPDDPCDGGFGDVFLIQSQPNCEEILDARSLVFRYAIFGHDQADSPGSSGRAEIAGNDMIVTFGGWSQEAIDAAGGQNVMESGTFMHELGHTLGLRHGGSDDINCKPNYLSVMSYNLQHFGVIPNRPLDFSRSQLPTLNESSLQEPAGVGGSASRSTYYSDGIVNRVAPAGGPIDWNGDGDKSDSGLSIDVNWVDDSCGFSPGEQLHGFDDWANIDFNFRDSPDFADGARTLLSQEDYTGEDALAAAQATDFDADGFSNAVDNCPAVANSAQTDFDGDTTGDHCDDSDGDSHLPPAYTVCEGICPGGRFSDHVEATIGTDPTLRCPADTLPNNEDVDAWPPDLNDDRTTNLSDIVRIGPHYNKVSPNPGYLARMDFNLDGRVNLADLVLYGPSYNKTCTP